MSLIGLLVTLLVICVVYWAVVKVLAAFGVAEPFRTVVIVIFVLLAVGWLIGQLGYGGGLGTLRIR